MYQWRLTIVINCESGILCFSCCCIFDKHFMCNGEMCELDFGLRVKCGTASKQQQQKNKWYATAIKANPSKFFECCQLAGGMNRVFQPIKSMEWCAAQRHAVLHFSSGRIPKMNSGYLYALNHTCNAIATQMAIYCDFNAIETIGQ